MAKSAHPLDLVEIVHVSSVDDGRKLGQKRRGKVGHVVAIIVPCCLLWRRAGCRFRCP